MDTPRQAIVVLHDIRSTHNVGAILRTCEGLGVAKVYFSGYTPYPKQQKDTRLPYQADKIDSAIAKTALGAELLIDSEVHVDIQELITKLKSDGYQIIALEQDEASIPIDNFHPKNSFVLILGREVEGIDREIIDICDQTLEIPMQGKKESFNVSVAAGIALYQLLR